jgi:fatty acid desaturase
VDELLLYWVVPMLWCYSSFFYWSEIEDHFNTNTGTRTNVGWTNWLTHNNGFHSVHHKYPRIPWYRLREAHFALCADSSDISRGFLDTFRQISTNPSRKREKRPPLAQPVAVST